MPTPFVILLVVVSAATSAAPSRPPAPVYTNEDLERLAPFRDQTGGSIEPSVEPAPTPARRGRRGASLAEPPGAPDDALVRARKEDHWRREAERVRLRVERLHDQIADLKQRLESRPRRPTAHLQEEPQVEALKRRIERLEARIREEELQLAERARRDGAFPGWIR